MATNTLVRLFQVSLTDADAELYKCPALTRVTIIALYKVNIDAVARTFRIHHVASGGSSGIGNALYYDEPLAAKRVHPRIDSGIILEPGQSIRGVGSVTNTITLTAFGILTEEQA